MHTDTHTAVHGKAKKPPKDPAPARRVQLAWEADFLDRYGVAYLGWNGGHAKAANRVLAHVSVEDFIALIPRFHADYPARVQGRRKFFDFIGRFDALRSTVGGNAAAPQRRSYPDPSYAVTLRMAQETLPAVNPAWRATWDDARGAFEVFQNGAGTHHMDGERLRAYVDSITRDGQRWTYVDFLSAAQAEGVFA